MHQCGANFTGCFFGQATAVWPARGLPVASLLLEPLTLLSEPVDSVSASWAAKPKRCVRRQAQVVLVIARLALAFICHSLCHRLRGLFVPKSGLRDDDTGCLLRYLLH